MECPSMMLSPCNLTVGAYTSNINDADGEADLPPHDDDVDHGYYSGEKQHKESSYIGYTISDYRGSAQVDMQAPHFRSYPNVEAIRKFHDLHSLLPWIHPEQLQNALLGPQVHIVEEETDAFFAYQVPKKMLVLFCGRPAISMFLRTLEREDNGNWRGCPMAQELRLPHGVANHVGIKVMIAWMVRACCEKFMGSMKPIRVPKNPFAAISLARTLEAFGPYRNACRVDHILNNRVE